MPTEDELREYENRPLNPKVLPGYREPYMGAELSPCKKYRYTLERRWYEDTLYPGVVLFVMVNPSTADATEDDATIRRCIGYTRDWGYGGFGVVNLFGRRTKAIETFRLYDDPVGPGNDEAIRGWLARRPPVVVCAWGALGKIPPRHRGLGERRAAMVVEWAAAEGIELKCLGYLKGDHPQHPLMAPGNVALLPFPKPPK